MLCVAGVTFAFATVVGVPNALVTANPVTEMLAFASTVKGPKPAVIANVVGVTFASATTVTEPRPDVTAPTLDSSTGKAVPQAPSFQDPLPQPLILAISLSYLLLLRVRF